MPPKKAPAADGGPEKLDPEELHKQFQQQYKKRCDEQGVTPLPMITKDLDEPSKIDWLILNPKQGDPKAKDVIKPKQFDAILTAIKGLDRDTLWVRHFTCWSCGLGDRAATESAMLLQDRFKVEKYDLFDEGVTAEGVAALVPPLTTNTVLKELQLSYNIIGDAGVELLCTALTGNVTLESLQLGFCGITTAGATVLSQVLLPSAEPPGMLRQLCVRGNSNIGIVGARALLGGVHASITLTTLDISETFKQNHELVDENVSVDNPIGLRNTLRDAVAGHPTLAEIDLRGNHIDAEDGTTLLALVTTCNKLTDIKLDRDSEVYDQVMEKSAENKAKAAKGGKSKKKKKK